MLYGVTIDLKLVHDPLTGGKKIKILEFNDIARSGYSGWAELTDDREDMLVDRILPFYSGLGLPFYAAEHGFPALYRFAAKYSQGPTAPRPQKLSDYKAILMSFESADLTSHWNEQYPDILLVNNHMTFQSLMYNKAAFALLAAPHLGDFTPAQAVYQQKFTRGLAPAIIDDLGRHDHYVIKKPRGIVGTGFGVAPRNRLHDALRYMFGWDEDAEAIVARDKYLREGLFKEQFRDARDSFSLRSLDRASWMRDPDPVFIAQKFEPSIPVKGEWAFTYDGTMRVAATFMRGDDGVYVPQFHGAYWKLPFMPLELSGVSLHARTLSRAQGRPKPSQKASFAQERESAAVVSPSDRALVEKQLAKVLPPMLAEVLGRSYESAMGSLFSAPDVASHGTAAMMAIDPMYLHSVPRAGSKYQWERTLPDHIAAGIRKYMKEDPVYFIEQGLGPGGKEDSSFADNRAREMVFYNY